MSAVTYSDERVQAFLDGWAKARLHCEWEDPTPEMRRFGIVWTPTFIVLDPDGAEHHRTVGFLSPEEFIAQLNLGKAKIEFDHERFEPAGELLRRVIEDCPRCPVAPEASYFLGVSKYKETHDAHKLRETWERLSRDYPGSEWAHKAEPFRDIP